MANEVICSSASKYVTTDGSGVVPSSKIGASCGVLLVQGHN